MLTGNIPIIKRNTLKKVHITIWLHPTCPMNKNTRREKTLPWCQVKLSMIIILKLRHKN